MPRRSRGVLALAAIAAFVAVQTLPLSFVPPSEAPQPSARRQLLGAGVSGLLASALGLAPANAYELPPLPYAFDALEPSIDKETMQIHHDKHHNTYLVNINKALEGKDEPPILDMQKGAIKVGGPVRNSGGGYYNHNFFWLEMAPTGTGGKPSEKLASAIDASFGSMDDFKAKFEAAGAPGARFGSGWVWLIVKDGKLEITSTPNQDNPLMEGVDGAEGIPILGIDVWEHAYYLKYQWQRPAYIKAWWDVVNWNVVSGWYEDALQGKAPGVDASATAAAVVSIKKAREATAKKSGGSSFNFKFNTGFEAGVQFGS